MAPPGPVIRGSMPGTGGYILKDSWATASRYGSRLVLLTERNVISSWF